MKSFRFVHPVEIVVVYEADTVEDARTLALMASRDHTVADLVHNAADLFILAPRSDKEED